MLPVWMLLAHIVLPLWAVAGFFDYLCHRRSDVEHASGLKETLIHWLMMAEVGFPILLVVFFRINALVMALAILSLIAHEVTGYYDLKLAMATRKVTILEHQIHSVLEIFPFTALILVMALHWPQAQALFGFGPEHADFSLGAKQIPRWGELIPPLVFFLIFVFVPYAQETWRGLRARPVKPHPPAKGN